MKTQSRLSLTQISAFAAVYDKPAKAIFPALLDKECQKLLTENQNVYYDEGLFWHICCDLRPPAEVGKWISQLTQPISSLRDMAEAIPTQLRITLLRYYLWKFKRMITV